MAGYKGADREDYKEVEVVVGYMVADMVGCRVVEAGDDGRREVETAADMAGCREAEVDDDGGRNLEMETGMENTDFRQHHMLQIDFDLVDAAGLERIGIATLNRRKCCLEKIGVDLRCECAFRPRKLGQNH